ncbi:TadE/TadG family type IV pilus assembly protein [Sphingosinicella sp. CPCC 101087]|uniref:TadE/TadG family type IV pilus assembly protein n=1 Tax=Sphingosinicella sp. CPCC 101087 TaxID=2497754 RepID=UPI001FB166D7|nr:pilus assembly protein [Sphingosinicella sp. CPCC 101087]
MPLPRRLASLSRDDRAVVMIEFAYALPVVVALALGALEATNLALAHLRVSQVAMTTADNAARVVAQIDESDIDEIFAGAELVGRSLDFEANGRIILSSLQENGETDEADAGQTIRWQRCFGDLDVDSLYGVEGDGADDDSLEDGMGPEGKKITAQAGTAIMFVEVVYDYQPLVTENILGPMQIRYESAFNVRERTELGITNVQTRPVNGC